MPFLVLGLWGLYVLWTGWGTVSSGWSLLFGSRPANLFQAMAFAPLFALNLWACAAGLVFGLVIGNPFAWLNGRRLIIGSMALAMILGRLASGWVASLMLELPGGGVAVFAASVSTTIRNPKLLYRTPGSCPVRLPERQRTGLPSQPPPRRTRFGPEAGPSGSSPFAFAYESAK